MLKRWPHLIASAGILLASLLPSKASDFVLFDHFERPTGAVGRDWSNATDNTTCHMIIRNYSLSVSATSTQAGIYRPLTLTLPDTATISADLTQGSGYGGELQRYVTTFLIRSNGSSSSGYGLIFYRGGQSYSDSSVILLLNGSQIATATSSFQFGATIHVVFSVYPDGSIVGTVTDVLNHLFKFTFPFQDLSGLTGTNVLLQEFCPDPRGTTTYTYPTIKDLQIDVR